MAYEASTRTCLTNLPTTDAVSALLGILVVSVEPGSAALSMLVTSGMSNTRGTCHGQCSLTYLRPADCGEPSTAHARQVAIVGWSGLYDMQVLSKSGQLVAVFQGHSRLAAGFQV